MLGTCDQHNVRLVIGPDDEVLLALVELAGAGVDVLLEPALAHLEVAGAAAVVAPVN